MRIGREHLLQLLQLVSPGLSNREIVEQSTCFIFKDGLLQTFNDEIACTVECDLNITGAIQAKPLQSLLQKMNEDEVEIEERDGEVTISGNRRKGGIRMDKEILLSFDQVERPKRWVALPEDFGEAVDFVKECTSSDESKFVLTCIHLTQTAVEASDSFQLAHYRIKLPLKEDCLVRKHSIKHITTLGTTEVSETPAWVHFRNPSKLVLSCRRFIDKFPDVGQYVKIAKDHGALAVLPKSLSEAVARAEIFSSENLDSNLVTVELKPGKLRLTGRGASGWFQEIAKMQYEGEELQFLISPKLLQELVAKHNECRIADELLRVHTGKFTYAAVLQKTKGEE